ncbi:MAG: peptidoglycan bridge formation glycyltransferase FemA/FemB family protein [Parcubacteria group bacterium]
MTMTVRSAQQADKDKWNDFVRTQQMGSFLQSWEWSQFVATQKDKIWCLIVEDEGGWEATIFLFKTILRGGFCTLESPRGPVVKEFEEELHVNERSARLENINSKIVDLVDEIAAGEDALLFQVEPATTTEEWSNILTKHRFERAEVSSSPSYTLILDLQKTEDEILAGMQQKTRYNVRLAQKKGVTVSIDNDMAGEFYDLLKKTMRRQGFNYFGKKYYEELLKLPFVKLYLAQINGKTVAANIMVFWNDTATYLFGASDYGYRDAMAPYLLQWQAISDAKMMGMKKYDFWGVAPEGRSQLSEDGSLGGNQQSEIRNQKLEKWAGFTKFKKGFSPATPITGYVGTFEKIYRPLNLRVYRLLRRLLGR